MTAPAIDLDETTIEEIQPPCDARYQVCDGTWHDCDNAAEWIVRTSCRDCGHAGTNLLCERCKHLITAIRGRYTCARCKSHQVGVAAERL